MILLQLLFEIICLLLIIGFIHIFCYKPAHNMINGMRELCVDPQFKKLFLLTKILVFLFGIIVSILIFVPNIILNIIALFYIKKALRDIKYLYTKDNWENKLIYYKEYHNNSIDTTYIEEIIFIRKIFLKLSPNAKIKELENQIKNLQ